MNNIVCLLIAFDFSNLYKFDPNKGDFYSEQMRYKSICKDKQKHIIKCFFLTKRYKKVMLFKLKEHYSLQIGEQ